MKKTFFCLIVLFSLHANGQKLFSEGKVRYLVQSSINGRLQEDSIYYTLMIKGGNIRSEMVANIGKSVHIYDLREGAGAVLREFGKQKILIPLDRNNWTEICRPFTNLSYASETGDSTINGYACKKTTATMSDGESLSIWFTEDIYPEIREVNFPLDQLKGFPLLIEMQKGSDGVVYSIINIDFDPVPVQYYDIPKSGYSVLSYTESKKIR